MQRNEITDLRGKILRQAQTDVPTSEHIKKYFDFAGIARPSEQECKRIANTLWPQNFYDHAAPALQQNIGAFRLDGYTDRKGKIKDPRKFITIDRGKDKPDRTVKIYRKSFIKFIKPRLQYFLAAEIRHGVTYMSIEARSETGYATLFTVFKVNPGIEWTYQAASNRRRRTIEGDEEVDGGESPFSYDDVPPLTKDESDELKLMADALDGEDDSLIYDDEDDGVNISPNSNSWARKSVLPPNLPSGFGGVDVSHAIFSPDGFKPNLFKLDISDPKKSTSVMCTGADGRTAEYTVPDYVNLTWASTSDFFSAVGSTKREFTQNLSQTANLDVSLFGFGAEFKRTFNEETREETFRKYMARYDQEIVYRVGLKDPEAAADNLTDDAKNAFSTWTEEKVVKVFGTHFMTEVSFGGLRIVSSTLDTRDTFSKKELTVAIDLKAPIKDPDTLTDVGKVHGDGKNHNKVTETISEKMDIQRVRTIGGTAPDGETLGGWRRTLASNPAAVKYKIRSLEELFTDKDKKAKIQAAIKKHLAANQPLDNCSLIAIRVPLKPYFSDRDSQGKYDMSVAYPDVPEGWLRVGQFAQGTKLEYSFAGTSYALAVKQNPNLTLEGPCPCPPVFSATTADRKWTTRQNGVNFGLFTPVYDPPNGKELLKSYPEKMQTTALKEQYVPLGDIFEPSQTANAVQTLASMACFHTGCLKDVPAGSGTTWIWNDSQTGGDPDVVVLGAPNSVGGDSTEHQMILKAKETGLMPTIFKTFARSTDMNTVTWKTLDWAKIQLLDNKWLSDFPSA